MATARKKDALEYHSRGRPGKLEVISSKPCLTQHELSLAYTPGVAQPCLEIAANPDDIYTYTTKGNLVAVVSNGTAVLGLGDIGAPAGKPVMEGKGVLFKRFADIDVFDIEVDSHDPDEVVNVVRAIACTFGGINLEDIKAPECFYIEDKLKEILDIPVFHDDQHGTAIISGAGLLNALEIVGKDIAKAKVVVCGAGAAGLSCAKFYVSLGVRMENLLMVDKFGVLREEVIDKMNPHQRRFCRNTDRKTLADALEGADVFLGVSAKGLVSKAMVASMAKDPVVFAMANPDPEITYEDAKSVRDDLIMATGRSDFPNQVNNVLGFPFIFRGALDVRAKGISEGMKLAAARALAALAKEEVPDQVCKAYGGQRFHFGRDYIIPKPFDCRVLTWESSAVAKAACDEGLARVPITDFDEYRASLERRINPSATVMRRVFTMARAEPKRIVFPEGESPQVVRAAQRLLDEGMATPILIGRAPRIAEVMKAEEVELKGAEIVDPPFSPLFKSFVKAYGERRQRRGVTKTVAHIDMRNYVNFAMMMVQEGHADGAVAGLTMAYGESLRPALRIVGPKDASGLVTGMVLVLTKEGMKAFADVTVNIDPTPDQLARIAVQTARFVKAFGIEPRVAMLSFESFGGSPSPQAEKVRRATEIVKAVAPDLVVDGEMRVDVATVPAIAAEHYPFSAIQGDANVLVFPSLEAANIGVELLSRLGGATLIGPVMLGMVKAVNVMPQGSDVDEIVNLAAFTVVKAQGKELDL